jgi:hypothetical protein
VLKAGGEAAALVLATPAPAMLMMFGVSPG